MLAGMRSSNLWRPLMSYLGGWAERLSEDPDGITVQYRDATGGRRRVHIEMSRDDWDEFVTIPWGSFDSAAARLREILVSLPPGETKLVYDQYDLVLEKDRYTDEDLPDAGPNGVLGGYWTPHRGDPIPRFHPPRG